MMPPETRVTKYRRLIPVIWRIKTMNTTTMNTTLFGAVVLFCSAPLLAQYPPAQGPLAPLATDLNTEIPIRKMVDVQLREMVAAKLIEVNSRVNPQTSAEIDQACQGEQPSCNEARAHISAAAFTTPLLPSMTQTKYTDQPNSKYLKVPYRIELKISNIRFKKFGVWVTYPFSRTAFVDVEIGIYCDRWETGLGEITAEGRADRPYLDDPSFSEQVVSAFFINSLIPAVDSGLRSGLAGFVIPPVATGISCNRMDYLPGNPASLFEGLLRFKQKPVVNLQVTPNLTVKLVQIKRLPLRTPTGQVVYDAIETPSFEFYANFAHAQLQLPPITEGQTLSLAALPALSFQKPDQSGSLILIANISHYLGNPEDSTFAVFQGSGNFGAGRRTLTVSKTYSYIPQYPAHSKPIRVKAPAYEITVDVSLPAGTVLSR